MSFFNTDFKSRFKIASKGRILLVVSSLMTCLSSASASPNGGVVISGNADIATVGNNTSINQSTNKAIINWQNFSINKNESVNFNQPNQNSITLNKVVGNEKSVIAGILKANGKVFLVNKNGVVFSKDSKVDTSGFLASTLDITDENFNNENFVFETNGNNGSVINLGTITATNDSYVALLGKQVINEGIIVATKGTVSLNSGDKITLNFNGNSLIDVTINKGTLDSLVETKQAVYADGGKVILTAKAADELIASQVNIKGLVQAQTVNDLKGEVIAYAYGGTTTVDGKIDASAPTKGDGGFIETSGDKVKIKDSAIITTKSTTGKNGTWLIDPTDFTIGANGDMTGTLLSSLLGGGNITISSVSGAKEGKGDINVNDAVSWSSDSVLTLMAQHDININNAITISGANAGLMLDYGGDYNIRTKASYSGTELDANGNTVAKQDTSGGVYGSVNFLNSANTHGLTINGNNYTLIHSMSQLDALNNASGRYALASNFDASGTIYHYALISTLSGTLYGLGHSISNLTIKEFVEDYSSNTALIGESTSTAMIRDISLINVGIEGFDTVGGLVGFNQGSINNAYVTGSIKGNNNVGGLVGVNGGTYDWNNGVILSWATIKNSLTNVSINLNGSSINEDYDYYSSIGGLVGMNGSYSQIMNSNALGDVSVKTVDNSHSISYVGGLVGFNVNSIIADSYASGNVTTSSNASYVGGLAGSSGGGVVAGTISNSFALGNVVGGRFYVGGLVGANNNGASIIGSYAKGNVSGTWGDGSNAVGGLVGFNMGTVDRSYATGNVFGSGDVNGGLVGNNGGTISNSYATGDVSSSVNNIEGGLVGLNSGIVTDSYAIGNVSGESVGGLVGGNSGTIMRSYATGDVKGSYFGGGLVGTNDGTISNSYATGSVSGNANYYVGGMIGRDNGTTTDSNYHDAKAEAAAAEQARQEAEQLAQAQAEQARQEAEQLAQAQAEQARQEAQRLAQEEALALEKLKQEEQTKLEILKLEKIQKDTLVKEELLKQHEKQNDNVVKENKKINNNLFAMLENMFSNNEVKDLVNNNVNVISPEFKADVKTINVDGVEYQVNDEDNEE